MLQRFKGADSSTRLLSLLGIALIATLILEIARSGGMTKTEVTLFGILQFVFALTFAWILSKVSNKREFEEGQRKFAIAAYRRVREIERMIDRLLMRSSTKGGTDTEISHEVEVIKQIGIGIQDTVRSSISDWA